MASTKLNIIMEAVVDLTVDPREAIVAVEDNREDSVEEVVDSEVVIEVVIEVVSGSGVVPEVAIDHAVAAIRKRNEPNGSKS
jgi:ribosome-binding ATPase YchF (GTP1/OBG family)